MATLASNSREQLRRSCIAVRIASCLLAGTALFSGAVRATTNALDGLVEAVGPEHACGMPQIGFFGDTTTALANGTVYYRRDGGPWMKSPIRLTGAHALTRLLDGRWIIADTDANRLVQVNDLSSDVGMITRSDLAGFVLTRPHFVIIDPKQGDIYVIDFNRRLFHFREITSLAEAWTFSPAELGYVRALSWFDDHLHVIHSSRGEVLRIDDYERHRYTRFRSPRPADPHGVAMSSHRDFGAGSLSTTGLILNDVQKSGDWYYGSNDFLSAYASGADTRPARLIRWRTWHDFAAGQWQDLSDSIATADRTLVPYFLSIHNNVLYAPLGGTQYERCQEPQWLELPLKEIPLPSSSARLLRGAPNFRDVGGYRFPNGWKVRQGVLYRSDALSELNATDEATLQSLRIGKITDFRTPVEVAAAADRLPQELRAKRVSLPIAFDFEAPMTPAIEQDLAHFQTLDPRRQWQVLDELYLKRIYPGLIHDSTPIYRQWLQGLLDTTPSAQVMHCTAGADRTGVATAIFLLALDVPQAAVMADYLRTNDTMFTPRGIDQLNHRLGLRLPASMRLYPRYLDAALSEMEREYGSIDAYLRDGLGADDDFRRRLRERYLVRETAQ